MPIQSKSKMSTTMKPKKRSEQSQPHYTTRSNRAVRPPEKLNLYQNHYCHLLTQGHVDSNYDFMTAQVAANVINQFNMAAINNTHKHHAFVETYSLKRGIKTFGQRAKDAAFGEMKQLHERAAFVPIDVSKLSPKERRRAMRSLIFIVEKRDKSIKARNVADGSTQRAYVPKEQATSPTALTESILMTATIEAKEGRDVMTADIPNAFIQSDIDEHNKKPGERIIMKITGVLVDILVQLDPDLYGPYVTYENGVKVLYVQVLKALYGMLQSSLLFYRKFRKDIEDIGFEVNPYDPCVANRTVSDQQQTVVWHIDDLKSSHMDSKVNDEFRLWLEKTYAADNIGKVKVTRGKRHDYLGMTLDYTDPGKVKIDMIDYVKNMVEDFPEELDGRNAQYPWSEGLFKVDSKSPDLSTDKAEDFHTFVAKTLFVTKRGRPDVQPAVSFLATRVRKPTDQDWFKLKKMMRFLKRTEDDVLTLEAGEENNIQWYLDAAFAVHEDYKSHTGAACTLGKGAVQSVSTKQKVNTRSSTGAELVSDDDIIAKVVWTKRFLEAQGLKIKNNVVYRDNLSTMKLEQNGKASSGQRTRHFHIKYFYITDLLKRKELSHEYCPTDKMLGDYMSKPLMGPKFHTFRSQLMNLSSK